MKRFFLHIIIVLKRLREAVALMWKSWLESNSPWIITLLYGDFWNYRNRIKSATPPLLYSCYTAHYSSYIGIRATISNVPVLPHNLYGIFISNSAVIGKNVIIFQHVTIGSNGLPDSKGFGAPTIGDNVILGAGAKIIGNVRIGNNSRIGAGCVVVKDVAPNTVVVNSKNRVIEVQTVLENKFQPNTNGFICK